MVHVTDVNVDKTNIMIFPKTKANDICIKLSDNYYYCRYLGIFLDDTLTWSHHIDAVYSKLMKYIGIFLHFKKLITLNNKLLHILKNKSYKFPVKDLYRNFDTLAIAYASVVNTCSQISIP